ncbi:MAG TPA: sensor histidine kinase, partial [Acidimicrobiia bacterium]|nr:sensor histidine kinase [Acidimicrobiia bacterium]
EALANAAKHAPGSHVSLVVDASADPLRLVVANGTANGAPPVEVPGGGAGLSGMEERIAALGGTFCAGPEGDGWVVAVTVPRMAPEPA